MTDTIIVYHADCHDGLLALWAALKHCPEAEQYPGRYPVAPVIDRFRDKNVIIVDFSWGRDAILQIAAVAQSLLILDHHVTARDALADLDGVPMEHGSDRRIRCVFDMERSGAGLSWDDLVGGERPWIVDYVEDRDLYRFALPRSREVHAAMNSYPMTLKSRDALAARTLESVADEGVAILRYHDKLVVSAARHALRERIAEYDVPSVACPTIELVSELGNHLACGEPFAAVWVERPDGSRAYSLRSVAGGVDVSEIAKRYGGGGHKHASGFTRMKGVAL